MHWQKVKRRARRRLGLSLMARAPRGRPRHQRGIHQHRRMGLPRVQQDRRVRVQRVRVHEVRGRKEQDQKGRGQKQWDQRKHYPSLIPSQNRIPIQ